MKYCFLDTETTAIKNGKIVQIAIKCDGLLLNELINPECDIPQEATNVHGITNEMVQNKPVFKESIFYHNVNNLLRFDVCFVIHNANFDIGVLKQYGIHIQNYICTHKLALYLTNSGILHGENNKLEYLYETLCTKDNQIKAHTADGDIIMLEHVFNRLAEYFGNNTDRMREITLSKIHYTIMPFGKYKGKKLVDIKQQDPSYLDWVINNVEDSYDGLLESIQKIGNETQVIKDDNDINQNIPAYTIENTVELTGDESDDEKASIADNPNTPPEILSKLADDENKDIRERVAFNRNTPPEILSKLADDEDGSVRLRVSQNRNTLPNTLSVLASDSYVRGSVAINPNTPPETLAKLVDDDIGVEIQEWHKVDYEVDEGPNGYDIITTRYFVRSSVAENPNTPVETLSKLADDEDGIVRRSVAENPNTPPETLSKLAEDGYEDVIKSVAQNPNTPIGALEKLLKNKSKIVRSLIKLNQNIPIDLLNQLSQDENYHVRNLVAENPNTPVETLSKLAFDSVWDVRLSVARNPNTSPEALSKLAGDRDRDIRGSVAKNPNTPPEISQKITENPYTPVSIQQPVEMQQIIKTNDYFLSCRHDRESLAENPNTPPETLSKFLHYGNLKIKMLISWNSNTPVETLSKLADDENWQVRKIVASNTNTPPETLSKLANDEDENVRSSVIQNLNTPPEVLAKFADDKSSVVRRFAARNSNKL